MDVAGETVNHRSAKMVGGLPGRHGEEDPFGNGGVVLHALPPPPRSRTVEQHHTTYQDRYKRLLALIFDSQVVTHTETTGGGE